MDDLVLVEEKSACTFYTNYVNFNDTSTEYEYLVLINMIDPTNFILCDHSEMSSQVEEFIPGGYPVTPQHENTLGDLENSNIENNAENDTTVDKAENKDVVNAENKDVENKTAKNDIENKTDDDIENKAKNVVKTNTENDVEKKAENKVSENKEKIAKSFPLKFEPNSSVEPTDDNNFTKATTNKGSSALGGIGINPTILLGIGPDSPPHPFYQESGELKDTSQKSDDQKTFDFNGDYNEQKGKEQIADKQEQQKPKDERVDLGIKPLGNQPLPSPYKPEAEGADRSVHKQSEGAKGEMTPPGKTTAVHPESQNSGPRITKRDRINATISKAVGIFKQKLGKLIKNDDLVARGTGEKDEADKTKENAEVQKKMNEF
ncbi:unnamed protein product [Rhizophagus irregularis]|nr:unnamed protein product [Rhizophagus irregularis]